MNRTSRYDESMDINEARHFLELVKERFSGENRDTYHRFKESVMWCSQLPRSERNAWVLWAKVKEMFSGHPDLICKFKQFFDYSRRNSELVEEADPEVLKRRRLDQALDEFIKKSSDYIDDYKLVASLVQKIRGFQEHRRVSQLLREAFALLKRIPELKILLAGFLVPVMKRKSVAQLQEIFKRILIQCEEELYVKDVSFQRILFAKEAAERLIRENHDKSVAGGQIDVMDYFSRLDFKCIKDELDGFRVLDDRFMSRAKAIGDALEILSRLDDKIRVSKLPWIEERKIFFQHEIKIPLWNWHSDMTYQSGVKVA